VKMTLLGTGVRTPYILHGLVARQEELGLREVVLHDSDPERLELMTAFGAYLCDEWGATFEVRGEPSPSGALAGARFVFCAIRVGQDRARALDEQIALKHGTLGQETTGPGGFAMAMRTIPAMLEYARLIGEVAPSALLINFTNPVGLIMQAVTQNSDVPVVGVCDGPIEMKRSVAAFLGVPGDEIHVDYAGLNHAGWIHRALVDGHDRMPELLARYEDLAKTDDSWTLFDPELVRTIGMLPMEYLYFYYYRDRAVQNIVTSGGSRGEQVLALNERLWAAFRERIDAGDLPGARAAWETALETRGATYFARERGQEVGDEVLAPAADEDMFEGDGYEGLATAVMAAATQRLRVPLILNVPNRGAIPWMLDDDVVEVTCMTDQHGAAPLAQGSLSEHARALLEPVKIYERLTVEAAVTGSYGAALKALVAHPLVGSYALAKSLLDDYLSAHAEFLGYVG